MHDQFGETSEVFDQHDPQCDCNRPKLANRQRLYLLIGTHEMTQHLAVEVAVCVCHERPGHTEHPGVSFERAVSQLWQLPVIAKRQIGADSTNLPLDEVVIVDQPLSRRRYGVAFID